MRNILYATDFSENAEKAFTYAIRMTQKHNANLCMVHLFDIPVGFGEPYVEDTLEMEDGMILESQIRMKALYKQYVAGIKNLQRPEYLAKESVYLVKDIIALIREKNIDLLVIGASSRGKVYKMFTGSIAGQLIRQSPCPVLAVPSESKEKEFHKVIYASDLLESDVESIATLTAILKPFDTDICVIHVTSDKEYHGNEKMEWFKEMVQERVKYKKMSFKVLVDEDVFNRLNIFIRTEKPDLLVMLEKEYTGFFDHLFHADLVIKMEKQVALPILSFNELSLYDHVSKPESKMVRQKP